MILGLTSDGHRLSPVGVSCIGSPDVVATPPPLASPSPVVSIAASYYLFRLRPLFATPTPSTATGTASEAAWQPTRRAWQPSSLTRPA